MKLYYSAVIVVIIFFQITHVLTKHNDENVVNVELDVLRLLTNILKLKGLTVSHNMDGTKMRADSDDDYVLKGRSTIDAVLRVRSLSEQAVSRGGVALAINLDIVNAFNSLPWDAIGILVPPLVNHQMPSYLQGMVGDYLRDRYIFYTDLTVAVAIAICQITHVSAKHKDENVINVELDIPKIVNDIFKMNGLKVSNYMEGGKMRADYDDYVLKIKFPHLGSIARMFLADRRYNTHPTVEVGPGAFKTEIVNYPADKLQNDLKKLLAIKKVMDKRNENVNKN